jgi:acyl dehydratase
MVAGLALPTVSYRLTRAHLRRYAEASGDLNPIHLDPAAARAAGLPDVIAHGMLLMGLALRGVEEWAGGPAGIGESAARWSRPVPVPAEGVDVTLEATVTDVLDPPRVRVKVVARCGPEKVMTMSRVTVALR